MAGMTIPDAMAMLWLRMVDQNEDPEFVEALKVAVAALDYSMGSRIDCDTCDGTGLLFRDDDDGGKTASECLVCEGFGHADPEIVKASWGEWPSATEVITKSEEAK